MLTLEGLDLDVSDDGDDVVCDRISDCDDDCDEMTKFEVGEADTWVEVVSTPGAVEGVVEAAATLVEAAAVLADCDVDTGWVELGVTPVPIGTLFCRLCRAISMWFVASAKGSTVMRQRSRGRFEVESIVSISNQRSAVPRIRC